MLPFFGACGFARVEDCGVAFVRVKLSMTSLPILPMPMVYSEEIIV